MAHEHRTFFNPPPADSEQVRSALSRGETFSALNLMVGAVLHGHGNWKELQELYLDLLKHEDVQVRRLAVTCLGHLGRVHQRLDETRVSAALREIARAEPAIAGTVEDALGDIKSFLHPRR